MNKKSLNETEICDQFISPSIRGAGWTDAGHVRREYGFTDGRVIVRGKVAIRGKRKRADYLLFHEPNLPIAIVEAKDNNHSLGSGMQQALAYAETLDVPFVFASNGDAFLFHDRTGLSGPVEQQIALEDFPSPLDLWNRYREWKGWTADAEPIARVPFHEDAAGKEPRYYQRVAVQRAVEAIAQGRRRVLLAMATGTGKTYTAFQIIWRLWKAGEVKRVLVLADRNILVTQAMQNDFKPFGPVMTKVSNRQIDKSYEVYLALYQAVSGTEDEKNVYKQFSRDFFDLIVIDECHRGSARDDSAWREILDYFESAIQLGLTATPKETRGISTLTYFGEPVYSYSLKQGIEDGFLAPYKVVRIDLDKDLQGWRPTSGMADDYGQPIEDRIFNQRDMDRTLVLSERTKRVAERIVAYLAETDPYGKTIVFCQDIDHAERMRSALVNEVATQMPHEALNTKFVVRITGDNEIGKRALDDFIHPEHRYPVIATTSKLLTTGVDAQTCRLIVLDQQIESMIEFKQVIGRGTRIHEATGKLWFTIMDFRKATELFADPEWDGEPVVVYEPGSADPPFPPEDPYEDADEPFEDGEPGATRYIVSRVDVSVVAQRVQYYGDDGKLVTESLRDYTRSTVRKQYADLDDFLVRWTEAERKEAVIEELKEQGVLLEALHDQVGQNLDAFDLICHVVYDRPPLTRRERAEAVKKRDVFTKYGADARAVLSGLLDKYADGGLVDVQDVGILRVQPLSDLGTPIELVNRFGGREPYLAAVQDLERSLYAQPA